MLSASVDWVLRGADAPPSPYKKLNASQRELPPIRCVSRYAAYNWRTAVSQEAHQVDVFAVPGSTDGSSSAIRRFGKVFGHRARGSQPTSKDTPDQSAGGLRTSSEYVSLEHQRTRIIADSGFPYLYREALRQREPDKKLARVAAPSGDTDQQSAKCLTAKMPHARHIVERSDFDRHVGREDRNDRDAMSSARRCELCWSSAPGAQNKSLTILKYTAM